MKDDPSESSPVAVANQKPRRQDNLRFLAAIIRSSEDAVISEALDGTITSWNPAAERMFGYGDREALGRPMSIIAPPDRVDEFQQIIDKIKKGIKVERYETQRRRKDESIVDVSVTVSPVKDENGNLLGLSAAELEASNRELEAFSYSVSHDLRAPLRILDGFSKAVLEDYGNKLDATGREFLKQIRSSSQLMARLIDDILNLARITRAEIHLETVDLSRLAMEVANELKRLQPGRQVDFIIQPNVWAYGDGRLLKIDLENLLDNAFKFTSQQPAARIEFGATDRGGAPTYFVRDNGAGFDMAYVSKLFKPFQRLHHPEEFAGTGIGLASVQRIVTRMGGKIWGEGEVGKGAAFYFTLREGP